MALDSSFALTPLFQIIIPGDLNNDSQVNSQDIQLLLSKYSTNDSQADLNSDGKVNGVDFGGMVK